ncbi:methyltransferase, TIGR04325 family [Leptospira congkakensis]|uniref:Methyltransferase, TIGR04325 family n=1 Tax=Leptospira congkakensis TaxID=2484932 RepID=A0A4Z1A6E4_9LEPT|nr:methyltransferase, TIGR04325 family [Leptospira congkakensis]TGL90233.1 methyltransferase, TIGR04325 family [Leptospira congkakensis]TGL91239.1 methyltransferase, TIGR04325 family [Leptospira congkakensis]TGL98292.1 methyltransferase, TIGR04325 family [Leptospira congkakensis]
MTNSPIVIFVYNRPEHTKRVIDSLFTNLESSDSDLIIYADYAKNDSHITKVNEVRSYIKSITGFKSIQIIERERNFGLAKSILSGVTDVLKRFETVIVLEDDIVVSPFFLQYMNLGLKKYKDVEKVASIHGYNYPIDTKGLKETFFIKGADCWGWGTWKRVWDQFETDGSKLLTELEDNNLLEEFNYGGHFKFSEMLKKQIEGKNDSWAVRWYASMFLLNKVTLYPKESLIQNIGLDSSGTHCNDDDFLSPSFSNQRVAYFPDKIENDRVARKRLSEYFESLTQQKNRNESKVRKIINLLYRKLFRLLFNNRREKEQDYYFGNFSSWGEAVKLCSGYASEVILEKVKNSLLKVKNGEAVYERDSVLFDEIHYSMPLLVSLLYLASQHEGKLNLLDFGGSLGSTYFQNRKFLNGLSICKWSIVEQQHFVKCGIENFQDDTLNFFNTIKEAVDTNKPNVILFSSTIQYLEDPFEILSQVLEHNFDFIIFDRTPLIYSDKTEHIMIQKVPEEIYKAEIPIRFMNHFSLSTFLAKNYEVFSEFDADEEIFPVDLEIKNKCIIFKKA